MCAMEAFTAALLLLTYNRPYLWRPLFRRNALIFSLAGHIDSSLLNSEWQIFVIVPGCQFLLYDVL
jgi:hypothetical protein